MALFLFPQETVVRLRADIDDVLEAVEGELFSPETRGMTIVFTERETAQFSAGGRVVALAIRDVGPFRRAIPKKTRGVVNYLEIRDERALARLDPYFTRAAAGDASD